MNLSEAIQELENFVEKFRIAVFADDKTPLPNALALREESVFIDNGTSEFNIIIFGDLNRFKGLNDLYGHDAGDIAIREAGTLLHEIVNEILHCKAFRTSGDEFVCLLTTNSIDKFLQFLADFAEINFLYEKKPLKTAMSFGYAISDKKTSFTDLLGRAELACQSAKITGDGICVKWTEELERDVPTNLRSRCQKCGAGIVCNIPKQSLFQKLRFCPCCGETLQSI